jgi:hypothetical protein
MSRITIFALVFVTAVTTATLLTSANAQRLNVDRIERDANSINRDGNALREDSRRGARDRRQERDDSDALVGAAMRGDTGAVLRDVGKVRGDRTRNNRDNLESVIDRGRLRRDRDQLRRDVGN